jgi:hypothetical protein
MGYDVGWDAANKIVVIYPMSSIGEPAYNNVITQAQQNAAKPAAVQKLESALGITMTTGDGSDWYYDQAQNADGTPNSTFISQNMNNSFVVVNYIPSDSNTSSEVDVAIECVGQVSSKISMDISPLQEVLDAFFPGQDAAVQQVMAFAQQEASHAQTHYGFNPIPGQMMTINGTKIGVGQGNMRTFASMIIYGS